MIAAINFVLVDECVITSLSLFPLCSGALARCRLFYAHAHRERRALQLGRSQLLAEVEHHVEGHLPRRARVNVRQLVFRRACRAPFGRLPTLGVEPAFDVRIDVVLHVRVDHVLADAHPLIGIGHPQRDRRRALDRNGIFDRHGRVLFFAENAAAVVRNGGLRRKRRRAYRVAETDRKVVVGADRDDGLVGYVGEKCKCRGNDDHGDDNRHENSGQCQTLSHLTILPDPPYQRAMFNAQCTMHNAQCTMHNARLLYII